MIGRTLSHYKVLEEISRGGMGIVYKALDLKLNREVALKVPPGGKRACLTVRISARLVKKLMRLPDDSIGAVHRAVPDSERALQLEFGHPSG